METTYESMDLAELCAATGATPRTVRYYIQQGLLPAPGAGRDARKYGAEFFYRLRLIRQLQREHLPLAEIRQRLQALTLTEIVALGEPAGSAKPPGDSARDYIERLMGPRSSAPAPVVSEPSAPASAFTHLSSPSNVSLRNMRSSELLAPLDPAAGNSSAPSAASTDPTDSAKPWPRARSQWERLVLHEDVELHLRRPASREMNRRIERLIEAARRILEDE